MLCRLAFFAGVRCLSLRFCSICHGLGQECGRGGIDDADAHRCSDFGLWYGIEDADLVLRCAAYALCGAALGGSLDQHLEGLAYVAAI